MDTNEQTLDDIVKASGETTDDVAFVSVDDVVNKSTPMFAYKNDGPIPGQEVELVVDDKKSKEEEKKTAMMQLIAKAATAKMQKEREAFNKKSDDEKVKIFVVSQILQEQERNFAEQYGYMMSGPQRRASRSKIERQYAKGKIRVTPQQREDILYQLNLSSSEAEKPNPAKAEVGTAQAIGNLMTGI